MNNRIRVRYAPSPTGHLHIGNARTAIFNYLYARHEGGDFILRIEDTDLKRNVADGESSQIEFLKWLGLDWSEGVDENGQHGEFGPYRQSERNEIYAKLIAELLEKDLAYKAYDTEEELAAEREAQIAASTMPRYSGRDAHLTAEQRAAYEAKGLKPSIRFRVPKDRTFAFDDIVKGQVSFESNDIGDWVICKKDGIPTYNFAVVADDYLMEISHVLRGDDHISNTPKQLMIYDAFGWDVPVFGHMTLIVNDQHKKLSKRDESIIQFIEQYAELGYLPAALFNFITMLGWSPEGEEEIFSQEEFIKIFNPARLSHSPAVFDKAKLQWMNNQYVKKMTLAEVVELALPFLQKAGRLPMTLTAEQHAWATNLISLYHQQMSYGAEIVELTEMFFTDELTFSDDAQAVLAEETVPTVLAAFAAQLASLTEEDFVAANIKPMIKVVQKETGIKGKNLFMPIRIATTGEMHGPELPQAIEVLGKDIVLKRLAKLS